MAWRPSNEPTRYDKARVAQLDPIAAEIHDLGLPLIRFRKLNGILNALTMQIEDGGDSPEVNRLLLEALREGLRHQVGERRAKRALRAIDAFEQAEARRWEQVKAGTLPPIELTPQEQLDDLVQAGYGLSEARQAAAACDKWLAAWELVKQMAAPEARTALAFDRTYPRLFPPIFDWCSELEMELGNAGLDAPRYYEHRIHFVREFLTQFPYEEQENEDGYVSFKCAEGEALWWLGRQAEAEAVYRALVEKMPDKAWGYIGWSDEYCQGPGQPADYERAEAILLRALENPDLDHREDVLHRLVRLYGSWDRPENAEPYAAELEETLTHKQPASKPTQEPEKPDQPPPDQWAQQQEPPLTPKKLGRNDPCWCGSGKKYKRCHWRSDQSR